MKKIIGMALCLSMTAMLFTGCSSSGSGGADKKDSSGNNKVGVALPTKELQRWNQDGANIKKELEAAGYEVDLQYAGNDNAQMVSIVENMIIKDFTLPQKGHYGVGMFFMPQDEKVRLRVKKMFETVVKKEGLEFLGWRAVPTVPSVL